MFSSPMGYLHFYSNHSRHKKRHSRTVLVPYGVSTFLFRRIQRFITTHEKILVPYGVSTFLFATVINSLDMLSDILVPYGVSTFLFWLLFYIYSTHIKFSSPMGYLHFYSERIEELTEEQKTDSRPLWGIYISIQIQSLH